MNKNKKLHDIKPKFCNKTYALTDAITDVQTICME